MVWVLMRVLIMRVLVVGRSGIGPSIPGGPVG